MLGRLLENWTLKLLSLVIAVILWTFLMGERHLEVGYTVPLELDNVPEGLMVASEVPTLVDVRLSGSRTRLSRLGPSDLRLTLDLDELDPGPTTFRRLEERLALPGGVRVTRLSPNSVEVTLERVGEKSVPVKVLLTGVAAPGFELDKVGVKPETVVITGAESEIRTVNEVETDPVDISGTRDSFSQVIPLNHGGVYSRLKENKAVDVTVTIKALPAPRAPLGAEPAQAKPQEGVQE